MLVPVPAAWWQTPIWLGVLGFIIMGLLLGAFGVLGFSVQRVSQRVPLRVIRTLRADMRRAA